VTGVQTCALPISIEELNKFWKGYNGKHNVVVIIGGDGTVGPVVDAMIKNNIDIPIYPYGRGTANDFASFLRTNRSPRTCAKLILNNRVIEIDTLLVNDAIYACNVACGGAFTNGVTNYHKKSKHIWGKLAYFFPALVKAFQLQHQKLKFTVDDAVFELEVFLFYIANSKNIGGLKSICAPADIGDGRLDLMCIKKCGFFGKISIAGHQIFGKLHKCRCTKHITGEHFLIEHIPGDEIKHDFTVTDIDGNPGGDYPLRVRVGKKIKIISARR
jgi:diacylglycerol kinase (ATP)